MWKDNPDLHVCAISDPFEGDEWATYWREYLEGAQEMPVTRTQEPAEPVTYQVATVCVDGRETYRAEYTDRRIDFAYDRAKKTLSVGAVCVRVIERAYDEEGYICALHCEYHAGQTTYRVHAREEVRRA